MRNFYQSDSSFSRGTAYVQIVLEHYGDNGIAFFGSAPLQAGITGYHQSHQEEKEKTRKRHGAPDDCLFNGLAHALVYVTPHSAKHTGGLRMLHLGRCRGRDFGSPARLSFAALTARIKKRPER